MKTLIHQMHLKMYTNFHNYMNFIMPYAIASNVYRGCGWVVGGWGVCSSSSWQLAHNFSLMLENYVKTFLSLACQCYFSPNTLSLSVPVMIGCPIVDADALGPHPTYWSSVVFARMKVWLTPGNCIMLWTAALSKSVQHNTLWMAGHKSMIHVLI